jgi:LPXTG-motif cell wall-anchored protein
LGNYVGWRLHPKGGDGKTSPKLPPADTGTAGGEKLGVCLPYTLCPDVRKELAMSDFIGSVPFFIIMGVLLVGLVGLLIYMRKKEQDN